tara:strand:- start:17848 stop:18744 length:897 start_codon:yes stop_codon:yes gene_type:complete
MRIIFCFLILTGCTTQVDIIPDNNAPYYGEIPSLLLENYVNRLYIDLLGREPLDLEMLNDVIFLRSMDVNEKSRDSLIYKLQYDTSYIDGDISYNNAYFNRFYEILKVRLIEGAADSYIIFRSQVWKDSYINDSIGGDMINAYKRLLEYEKLQAIINSKLEYKNGLINIRELHQRLIYNSIYDDINMNTFNYINAVFDNLFFRYPTSHEFDQCKLMIDDNSTQLVLGMSGNSKLDFSIIACESNEFYEGLINWSYITFVGRESTVQERDYLMNELKIDGDYQRVQRIIMSSDEYAHFN